MSLVEGIMCHSIHYFTIVFNISLLQYVQLVSNVSLSCILYMLLPFDVGIIYLLDVNKCTHLVSGGIHSTFLEILLWSATEHEFCRSGRASGQASVRDAKKMRPRAVVADPVMRASRVCPNSSPASETTTIEPSSRNPIPSLFSWPSLRTVT